MVIDYMIAMIIAYSIFLDKLPRYKMSCVNLYQTFQQICFLHLSSPKMLTHLTPSGSAQMVSIMDKPSTRRTATACCSIYFSNHLTIPLIRKNAINKGDVLSVARIAGIMAAKRTSNLIPLCHPLNITHVSVELVTKLEDLGEDSSQEKSLYAKSNHSKLHLPSAGKVDISVTVKCDGKTGVEMEALLAASVAGLTIYDMCKAVDKSMRIDGLRIVRKEGGLSSNLGRVNFFRITTYLRKYLPILFWQEKYEIIGMFFLWIIMDLVLIFLLIILLDFNS